MNEFDRLFAISGLSLDRLRSFLAVAEEGNIAKAAKGDPTRQSQFSRQVKELEGFFGIPLTRRVGRRLELTDEGLHLARLIRRHFSDLDDFKTAMAGRPVSVRLGAAGSVLEWMVLPKLSRCRDALGQVVLDLEQMRSSELVRAVADGRLDFGVVREDAVPAEIKRWKLGRVGYALFASKAAWKVGKDMDGVFRKHSFGELLSGGQFHERYLALLDHKGWKPQVISRAGSFLLLARMVREEDVAAVLPLSARVEFDPKKVQAEPLSWNYERGMVLIANARSVDRAGIRPGSVKALAAALAWEGENR